ncbi:MAG: tetratricopeptide repeat protein [Burkholderiaceae bacterium]|nr:tetratricopeptide repeat protein [Burkholderiaceae bacterium]
MSLINKMLKDLDQRGTGASADAAPGAVRSVPAQSGGSSRSRLIVLLVLLLLASGGAAAWYFMQQPAPAQRPVQAPVQPPVAAAAPVEPAAVPVAASAVAPVASNAPPVASAVVPPTATPARPAAQAPLASPATRNDSAPVAANPGTKSDRTKAAASAEQSAASAERAMRLAMSSTLQTITSPVAAPDTVKAEPAPETVRTISSGRKKRGATTADGHGTQLKETTPKQQAENAYGRAVGLIGAGQKAEAMTVLESVLLQYPQHAAARQTLVGLLLNAKRSGDAARVLDDGLKRDASQVGMAMILARIQIEQSGSAAALATLQRSLPYATSRPDYLAFTAAMLQREKRHREAVTHYAHALRKSPHNAHWWMGYGISLQAIGQAKEARQAFVRARDLHKLAPELQAFVEQKISEIGSL